MFQVTTVSADVNIPLPSQPEGEEEDEDTVYTRTSPRQASSTMVTVDGIVATAGTSPTTILNSSQRHSGHDDITPATNV